VADNARPISPNGARFRVRASARRSAGTAASLLLALSAAMLPTPSVARELALAQGTIAIRQPAAGEVSPACSQLVVEARDGLDNHLIARTDPALAPDGSCRYAISVPAQSAVWLRLRPALVADARVAPPGMNAPGIGVERHDRTVSARAVQLRWTVIAPTTFFFAPNETKTVPLTY
jgi:hypothetical protein